MLRKIYEEVQSVGPEIWSGQNIGSEIFRNISGQTTQNGHGVSKMGYFPRFSPFFGQSFVFSGDLHTHRL